MRVTIERETREQSGWFSKKPILFLVHVTIDLTNEEFQIIRQQGVGGLEIYQDWDPASDQYLPVVLASLLRHKPCTLTFPNGAEAIQFEQHLKGTILPAIKSYLQAMPANSGPEVIEM